MALNRRVVACMSPREFGCFFEPVLHAAAGLELIRLDSSAGPDAMLEKLKQSESSVLLTAWSSPKTPADFKSRAPELKYLCHTCGTLKKIVDRQAIVNGLIVSNWGPAISRSVAEHTLVLMLCCLRNITEYQLGLHTQKAWPRLETDRGLFERRVGLHGMGNVARELIKLLQPFGCALSGFSPYEPDEVFTSRNVRRCASLQELYASNDIIACVAPLTAETRGSITEELLRLIPPGGVFVNTGRGAVVHEAGLARVAAEGNLLVGLDVYEQEPLPPDSPLRGLKNAVLTAHCAGPTPDRQKDCGLFALENIRNFFNGKPVLATIDAGKFDLQT